MHQLRIIKLKNNRNNFTKRHTINRKLYKKINICHDSTY